MGTYQKDKPAIVHDDASIACNQLTDRLDDLLDTLRRGRRRQEALDPRLYRYRWPYDDLPYGFNQFGTTD